MIIVNLCHCGVFNPLPSVTSYSLIKLVRGARVGGTGTSEKKWTRALASASSLQSDSFNSLPSVFFENSSTLTHVKELFFTFGNNFLCFLYCEKCFNCSVLVSARCFLFVPNAASHRCRGRFLIKLLTWMTWLKKDTGIFLKIGVYTP